MENELSLVLPKTPTPADVYRSARIAGVCVITKPHDQQTVSRNPLAPLHAHGMADEIYFLRTASEHLIGFSGTFGTYNDCAFFVASKGSRHILAGAKRRTRIGDVSAQTTFQDQILGVIDTAKD